MRIMTKPNKLLRKFFLAVAIVGIFLATGCTSTSGSIVEPENLPHAQSFLSIGGLLIHYSDSNPTATDQPVLVLQHGFGGNLANFSAIHDALAQEFRVIAFDRPPFGYSSKALPRDFASEGCITNPYTPQAQAGLLFCVLDELGIERAIVLGHSAGGNATLDAAAAHPERISAVILVAPAIGGRQVPAPIRLLMSTPPIRALGSSIIRRSFADRNTILEQSFYDPAKITPEIRDQYARGSQMADWEQALWQYTIDARTTDWQTAAHTIAQPVLIITGENDGIVAPERSINLHEHLQNSKLILLPETGHIPFQERPEECERIILERLSQISK